MSDGLVVPRPGARLPTLVPNVNVSTRELPQRISAELFRQQIALDAEQQAKFPGDKQLLRFAIAREPLDLMPGNVATLVIRGFPHRLYDKLGRKIEPSFSKDAQSNYVFEMGDAAAVNLLLEIVNLPGSPGKQSPLARLDLSLFVTSLIFTPQITLDDDADSFALDKKTIWPAAVRWIDNASPLERLFICEVPENEPAVKEVEAALKAAGLAGVLQKIPADVSNGDTWVQDQFEVGFCEDDRGNRMHMVLHLPRLRHETADAYKPNLSTFVEHYFPSRSIGLCKDFWAREFSIEVRDRGKVSLSFRDTYAISQTLSFVERLWSGCLALLRYADARAKDVPEPADIWEKVRYSTAIAIATASAYASSNKQTDVLDRRLEFLGELHNAIRDRFTKLYSDGAHLVLRRSDGSTIVDGALSAEEIRRLYDDIFRLHDSVNYGGNIEPTPNGHVVVGSSERRAMDPALIEFLEAQTGDDVFAIDTSWLKVGHVDELIAFVPAPKSAKKWVVLQNSSDLALAIVLEAVRFHFQDPKLTIDDTDWNTINGATDLLGESSQDRFVSQVLRGRYFEYLFDREHSAVPQLMPPNMCLQSPKAGRGPSPDKRFDLFEANLSVLELLAFEQRFRMNRDLAENQLTELSAKLTELGTQLVFLPVIFDIPEGGITEAFLPNMVNLQVAGSHVMVPRPGGPRMKLNDAITVLKKVLGSGFPSNMTAAAARQLGLESQVVNLRNYPESEYHQELQIGGWGGIGMLFPDTPQDFEQRLLAKNRTEFTPNGVLKAGWRRLIIPEQTVDLFELYTTAVLGELGLRVHFIDTWYYHVRHGGLHCGTNAIRKIVAR